MNQTRDLRRVRREDFPVRERRTDGLDVCLDCWIRSRAVDDKDLGTQTMKLLHGDGDGYGNEDTAQSRKDNNIASATGAMIDSLSRVHWWAIMRKTGQCTVWNYPNLDYIEVAVDACVELEKKLRNNVVTAVYFL